MAHDPAKKSDPRPKHKPSTKHTLHEVLNSLQDVLNNELADEDGVRRSTEENKAEIPNVLHTRKRDEVLSSLKALIGAAAAGEPLPTPQPPVDEAPESGEEPGQPDDVPPTEAIDPYLEHASESAGTDEFHLEMEDSLPPAQDDRLETAPPAAAGRDRESEVPSPASPRHRRRKPKQMEIGWDDIPVLNEVVLPAPEEINLEITPEIRDIAIQVAAALNIELKRAGKETLGVKVVMQLQTLLQRELAARGLNLQDNGSGEEQKE